MPHFGHFTRSLIGFGFGRTDFRTRSTVSDPSMPRPARKNTIQRMDSTTTETRNFRNI